VSDPDELAALDAYSRVVVRVAEEVLPTVASLRVMRRVPGGRVPSGSGSAVVVSTDGFLLTSAHVIAGAKGGTAVFGDGRSFDFEVVGRDALSDLAVVRVSADRLRAARIGDADRLRVGQLVVAVGSPLGFAGSVSAGVVSAVGRSITTSDGRNARLVENVIQTDACLHPGNSGGALAVAGGEVVGINTAVVGPGIGQGLGLAVPLNVATGQVVAALLGDGRVRRAFLGIAGGTRPLPPRAAAELGQRDGIEVTSVVSGSPAAAGGLRPEDVIVAVGSVPVGGIGDLQRLLTADWIGRSVPLRVLRSGEVVEIQIVPSELGNESRGASAR
jgi:S1-C subfamily serine protease